ncbi:TPA: phosphoribosylformylglycinamidine cyclo-ligase [archaeon]|uniref:Phosphoribosylformylglycinamidine cyclo-ligase n=1 Tax=Candidatus Naiadarchaeum limnaeum TaxID=2756139 RepID=A0A832X6J9_9ARCH|nr:phosphoribosylformylglycinamidine cyclo-ligase [Candidatus Naiadarchaeum limnaeum]
MLAWTYSKAGVNISKADLAKKSIAKILGKTYSKKVLQKIGHYCSAVDIGNGKAVAITTDGVGTKVLLAQKLGKYDTVGIDCVAMNVNDLICLGVTPIAMVDYIAIKKPDGKIISEIGRGLAKGAQQAGISIVGGETAILPEIIKGANEYAFDLAGTAIGIVEKKKIIDGSKIKAGDVLIGLRSSGIHSNGLTLARKVLNVNNKKVASELLKPTKIYVKPILKLINSAQVLGLAHMTGGGLKNLLRLNKKIGFKIENWPRPHKIFTQIQRAGKVSDFEMFKTFNMGIGFCVVVPKNQVKKTLALLRKENPFVVGKAIKGNKIIFPSKSIVYK